ncbi:MAG: glycosyltransferase family 4 protein [Bacteroidota bacterium]
MAKRILIYTNHFFPENFKVNEIVDTLKEDDVKIRVVTCVPNYPTGRFFDGYGIFKRSREVQGNVTIRRLPMISRGKGSRLRLVMNYVSYFCSTLLYTLYMAIIRRKYDVVFVHHTSPIMITYPPRVYKFFFRKTKLILWDLDIWPDTLKAVDVVTGEKTLRRIEKLVMFLYKKYDHILVGSQSFVEIVKKRVNNITVSYFPNWAEDNIANREIIVPEKEPVFPSTGLNIMFAGNIGQAQDMESVFRIAQEVRDLPVNWLFVGDGRMRSWLEQESKKQDMEQAFYFYGNNPITLMPYFFSKADIMLVSLKEAEIFAKTVPAKVQAYMASGKPILGMISGEGAALIREAGCGWTAESSDYKGMADHIREHNGISADELSRIGNKGREFYLSHFRKELRTVQLRKLMGLE